MPRVSAAQAPTANLCANTLGFDATMSFSPIAFGCLLSGTAGLAFVIALRSLVRAKRSVSWPTVDAVIVDAQVVTVSKGFRPRIVYRYRIAEASYESDRVVVGGMWGTSGDGSARLVRKHPIGSSATVAVDPKSAGYSVLVPGIRIHQVFSTVLCALVFLATLPALWAFTKMGTGP